MVQVDSFVTHFQCPFFTAWGGGGSPDQKKICVNHIFFLSFESHPWYLCLVFVIKFHNVALNFKSVDETLVCDYSNESY